MKNIFKNIISITKNKFYTDRLIEIDFSYLEKIKESNSKNLRDICYLENLLLDLGINNEVLSEIPFELHNRCGFGLRYWQYPNQFSQYLVLLSNYKINSYLEIGVRYGGTFLITIEYLKKFNKLNEAIGIDIVNNNSLTKYSKKYSNFKYYKMNSNSQKFNRLIKNKKFDLTFVDGNHEEDYCRQDFDLLKNKSNIIVLHDIISDACPGVKKVWSEIKEEYIDKFRFFEFTKQYDSVVNKYNKKYFGIGVAIRENWI